MYPVILIFTVFLLSLSLNRLVSATAAKDSRKVRHYFDRWYPDRSSSAAGLFRRGEKERLAAVAGWLPHLEGMSVLDAGCGDGRLLAQTMHGTPRLLRLEDIVARNVLAASRLLKNRADRLEAVAADIGIPPDRRKFDVVLALGITDYYMDWPGMIRCLLARTESTLLIDFPRGNTLHSRLRKLWLALFGLGLHATDRGTLNCLLAGMGLKFEITSQRLNWLVKIEV
ncbi:MAG: hypothetical protein V1794_18430 [Candidatus Glassbacteria bacterium]